MTLDEAIKHAEEVAEEQDKVAKEWHENQKWCENCAEEHRQLAEWLKELKRLKEQESCEKTVEEYRQRMIQVFHNADCDELIAICVLPTEKEFEHLEWLLRSHYKKEPKTDYKAFAKWIASEIFDENWEYNKDSFAELACRKLAKLGIIRAKGDEWELVDGSMKCEDCIYSDIADWEQNEKTGKAKAVYWCERHEKLCDDIQECQFEDTGESEG